MSSPCQKINFCRKIDFFENFQKIAKMAKMAILALFGQKSKIFKIFIFHLKGRAQPQEGVLTSKTPYTGSTGSAGEQG